MSFFIDSSFHSYAHFSCSFGHSMTPINSLIQSFILIHSDFHSFLRSLVRVFVGSPNVRLQILGASKRSGPDTRTRETHASVNSAGLAASRWTGCDVNGPTTPFGHPVVGRSAAYMVTGGTSLGMSPRGGPAERTPRKKLTSSLRGIHNTSVCMCVCARRFLPSARACVFV